MGELEVYTIRRVILLLLIVGVIGGLGYLGYKQTVSYDGEHVSEGSREIAQLQAQLSLMSQRIDDLEKERKADFEHLRKTESDKSRDIPKQDVPPPSQIVIVRPTRPQYIVSPASAVQPVRDPAQDKELAGLQQGVGNLQEESTNNREAWQAAVSRLADVAGQVGSQDGKIIASQDKLNEFLAQSERTSLSFELRRGSTPEPVGPIRLSLQTASEKDRRYTLCVYLQDSCVQVRDRAEREVVQLAVQNGATPLELIATRVTRDQITGYLEVPKAAGSGGR
jgi:uncharacterized coiled-coil protein SlyX